MGQSASKSNGGKGQSTRGVGHRAPLVRAAASPMHAVRPLVRESASPSRAVASPHPHPAFGPAATSGGGGGVSQAVRRLNGGAPLPPPMRSRMEASFGRSFEGVRVHTDAAGAELAQGVGAQAVTVEQRVAFAAGTFRPGTASGDHLIAHELAHVAQQGSAAVSDSSSLATAAQARVAHSQPSEPAEVAAEQAASAVSRGEGVRVAPMGVGRGAGMSTRARLMRQARAGAVPTLTVSTPVPGTGVGQEVSPTERSAPDQSGVFRIPSSEATAAPAESAAASGAAPPAASVGAPAAPVAAQPAEAGLDEETKAKERAKQKEAEREQAEQKQKAEAEEKKSAEPPPAEGGSPQVEAAAGVIEEVTAPSPATEALAVEVAQDRAEVAASEAGAEAEQEAAAATPVSEEEAKKAEKAPASPEEDPAFQAVISQARAVAFQQGHNNPAARKVAEMQQAVTDPPGAAEAQAKGAHVAGPMAAAEPAPFNKAAFEAAVLQAIANVEPGSKEQAQNFRVPGSVASTGSAATEAAQANAAGPVASAAAATPSAAGVSTQPGGPVPSMPAGPAPGEIGAEGAAPKPRSESEVEGPLRAPGKEFDAKLEESGFSEETFANSNEPELTGVLTERDAAHEQTEAIITANREAEAGRLEVAQGGAVASAAAQTEAMHATRAQEFAGIVGDQQAGKSQEEQARAAVNQKLDEIYNSAKKRVDEKLKQVDEKVNAEFARGVQAANNAYDTYTKGEVGSALNFFLNVFNWTDFKNRVYSEGKRRWKESMRNTISAIAGIAANGLNEAHQIAADGAREARTWLEKQPAETQRVSEAALTQIEGKFDSLRKTVDEHGAQLVNQLADKYRQALADLNKKIEEDKAKNMSLWEQAEAFLKEGLALLEKMKEMLLGVASSAAAVIDQILSDPIGFLSTLIEGVGQGLHSFVANIGTHLQKGLMGWLLGALPPGIELPETFDLKSIITLGLQILGLTYANFRARALAIVGEPVVKALETAAAEVFLVFLREGPAGIWRFIKDQLSNLKDMVMGAIRDFVIQKIVVAGITWLVSLLNPASALVRAIKMIVDIVMFFINRGSQIMSLVQAVVNGLAAIAGGNASAVAAAVENALARAIPVALSFLASLLGLGGIAAKIQSIFDQIRAPINKAIDFVINLAVKAVKAAGKLISGLFGGKKAEEEPKGAEGEEGDAAVAAKVAEAKAFIDEQEAALGSPDEIDEEGAKKVVAAAQGKRDLFKSISVERAGKFWRYSFRVNPPATHETKADEDEPIAGLHPVPREGAESHHVPAKGLGSGIAAFLDEMAAGLRMNAPDPESPAAKLANRYSAKASTDRVVAAPPGNKLSAIAVSPKAHTQVGGVHTIEGAGPILASLAEQNKIVLVKRRTATKIKGVSSFIAVNPQIASWRLFLVDVHRAVADPRWKNQPGVRPDKAESAAETILHEAEGEFKAAEGASESALEEKVVTPTNRILVRAANDAYVAGASVVKSAMDRAQDGRPERRNAADQPSARLL